MQQLDQLLVRLIQHEVEFVLVGGLAAWVHGSSLATRDLDVCCRFSESNLMRFQAALTDLHPVHRMAPELKLDLTPDQCSRLKNLYVKTDLGIVDCLGEIKGVGGYVEVLESSEEIELPAGICRIINVDALIRAKEAIGRPHDLYTVHILKALKDRQPPTAS